MRLKRVVSHIKLKVYAGAWIIGLAAGLLIFGIWMNIIGNPHVAETFVGIAISSIVWIAVFRRLRKWAKQSPPKTRR